MWSPTHVQVTVQRAKGLLTKGKNGTNNCFVTIALGKDKYQTSIREKASQNVEWHEECELAIPEKGNTAELILTCLHHNSLGIDEFLGQVTLPLRDMDAYDTPRPKWFKLQSKPGQEKKDKERGELEVRINFTVKAGSLSDLSKKEKHKSSFNQLASSVGGSLLSIGTLEKKKGIKKIATSIGSKLHLTGKKKDKKGGGGDVDSESFTGSMASIGTPNSSLGGSRKWNGRSYIGNTDPGVADDGDINFDRLSQRSSISNISYAQEHNINNSPTINRPSVTISSQNNFSNGVPENKNVPQNGDKSMGNQNNSNSNINVNQMDSDSTPSLKRRIWGKTRVPLPIPERSEDELLKNGSQKYDIRNSHFENEDHDVVLRAKDEPILQESRNSQMLDVPETHKPKPRQFLPSNTDDDFALDNLSCNSSPFSSLTSQSYYDYNPNNDSVRLSNKVEEDDEDSGFGTFSRGDSKRRASRKKYFAPVLKEREIEKRFEESMHNVEKEIIIDFEPQNNSKFEENKNEIEINSDTEISANPMYYSDNFFKKPDPPARRVKNSQIHNSPNFVKIEHENISAEYQFAEKYEKVNPESIAISTNKAKIIETRNEEVVKFNTGVAEITQVAPPLKVELEDIDNIATYERQPDTVIEKYPYFVSHKNEMIENKEEDYSDSKFEKSFKIPNSSSTITSEDEDDYESQYSEPELKTNKLNITKNVGNDSQTKTDSKVFQSIDFESNEANTKIPIARPRNPNAEVFNNLAESSSSNCSSLENMYLTVVVPKRVGNQDPGVIEDDDEFVFDKLSHKSSGSSLNISRGHNDYNHRIPSPVISKEEDRNSSKIPSPPAKPPRNASDQKLDEWESKLYGNHLEIGSTDSLKRRSWGNNRIPLNTAEENEEPYEDVKLSPSSNTSSNGITKNETTMNDINISPKTGVKSQQRNDVILETPEMNQSKENIEKISEEKPVSPKIAVTNAEVTEKKESKLEKLLNKSPLLRTQSREALDNSDLNINKRSSTNNAKVRPRALPRSDTISIFTDDVIQSPEDAKEIREKLKKDQKEISEKTEKIEKKHRFGKFKYFAKRGESKNDLIEENGFHGERHNPIGHENFSENENSLPELSPELLNKYDGKSREDIILIADSFEKEMVMERNRVKELEEYLDNLLLRVMETHPKILQNPYRTTSTKSFQRFSSFSG
ncbi:general transcriptional corepressor trfA isoform X6 [Condylostylus longicornis]|uniref:general transcriptional corepressor trfA isoform X6 n=1 Tax=Condylostylus longicornis TaxID=2530218 RepID=UPI00244DDE84|nr:general transcriptional corepressor trfA isoform X6 [Condylostylus longicornis]